MISFLNFQKYQHGKNTLPNMHGLTPQQQLVQQMAARGQVGYSALQQQQLQMQQLANAGMKQMPPLQQMGHRSKGLGSLKNNSHALAQQMRQGMILGSKYRFRGKLAMLLDSSARTKNYYESISFGYRWVPYGHEKRETRIYAVFLCAKSSSYASFEPRK